MTVRQRTRSLDGEVRKGCFHPVRYDQFYKGLIYLAKVSSKSFHVHG